MNNPFDSSPPSRRSRDLLNGSLSGLAFLACLDFRLDSVEAIFFHASKNWEFYIDEVGGILLKLYTVKKSDEPLAFAACFSSHSARPCIFCAFASEFSATTFANTGRSLS